MKKNKFYPLAGTAVFLLDQWIKDYVEKKGGPVITMRGTPELVDTSASESK